MKGFSTGDPRLSLNLRECVYALDVWGDYEISSPKRIEIGETVEQLELLLEGETDCNGSSGIYEMMCRCDE